MPVLQRDDCPVSGTPSTHEWFFIHSTTLPVSEKNFTETILQMLSVQKIGPPKKKNDSYRLAFFSFSLSLSLSSHHYLCSHPYLTSHLYLSSHLHLSQSGVSLNQHTGSLRQRSQPNALSGRRSQVGTTWLLLFPTQALCSVGGTRYLFAKPPSRRFARPSHELRVWKSPVALRHHRIWRRRVCFDCLAQLTHYCLWNVAGIYCGAENPF